MKILNLAAGKLFPLDLPQPPNYCLVQLDTMYYRYNSIEEIEYTLENYSPMKTKILYCNEDAFKFMERTKIQFDRICAYRFLEHVPMDQVLYFIYLLSTCLKTAGEVDIIVPNYEALAKMILCEKISDMDGFEFEKHNILLTTELLNEPSCPHASIWTRDRLIHFFRDVEGRFVDIGLIDQAFKFDGRDIYLRAKFRRIR